MNSESLAFLAGALYGPMHCIVYHIVSGHSRGCYVSNIGELTNLGSTDIRFCLCDLHKASLIKPLDHTNQSWEVNKHFKLKNHVSDEWLEKIMRHIAVARKTKMISTALTRSQIRKSLRKRRRNTK